MKELFETLMEKAQKKITQDTTKEEYNKTFEKF